MKPLGILLISAITLTGCIDTSDGSRAGTITKLSHKGLFCKTWEGELNMGGLRNTRDKNGKTDTTSNVFSFSVDDASLVPALQNALDSGKQVVLTYKQELFVAPCRGDTDYFVTAVKEGATP